MASEAMRRYFTPENEQEDLANFGVVPVPSPDEKVESQESDFLAPFHRPVPEEEMPPESLRRSLDEEQRLAPFFRRDTVAVPESLRRPVEVEPQPVSRVAGAAKAKALAAPAVKPPEAAPIPTASAPPTRDAVAPVVSTQPPVTSTSPAGKPESMGTPGLPAPSSEGAGGDVSERDLYLARLAAQSAAGFGSMGAGKNIDMGIADTLGERLKQVQALRAKREEQKLVDAQAQANNRAQVEYLMQRFPERREALAGLRDMTKSPNFAQMLRVEEQIALDQARKADIGAKAEDRAKTQEYRAGTLDLKRDIAKDNRDYRAVQAGLKQAELNLRAAENERKAAGSAEPSEKERSAFQASMKPAEQTAVALRDADTLNSLGGGMLVSGKPPAFLSRSDIAAFNGVPFGQMSRSQLAQSNPQAYDLLTKMAEIKTIIGHEYFGSALSPAEAERQRQFMDFSALDTPESIAKKMKNYHETLANKATVFLRPRVVGRQLGADWAQATGLDALSAPGGTFAGLLAAPKSAAAKAPTAPAATTTGGAPAVKSVPSARSIKALKADPSVLNRQYFDEQFGAGAAKKVLGE